MTRVLYQGNMLVFHRDESWSDHRCSLLEYSEVDVSWMIIGGF